MRRNTWRAAATVTVAGAILIGGAGAAFANDCFNASRNPNATPHATLIGGGVSIQGHWINFDNLGWGKIMPGTFGTNGNYTNGRTDEQGGMGAINGVGFCTSPNRDPSSPLQLNGIEIPEACAWGP